MVADDDELLEQRRRREREKKKKSNESYNLSFISSSTKKTGTATTQSSQKKKERGKANIFAPFLVGCREEERKGCYENNVSVRFLFRTTSIENIQIRSFLFSLNGN